MKMTSEQQRILELENKNWQFLGNLNSVDPGRTRGGKNYKKYYVEVFHLSASSQRPHITIVVMPIYMHNSFRGINH